MSNVSRAMIGLQTTLYGVVFGKVLRVSTSRLTFEVEHRLPVGETVSWRMELLGRFETVLGELVVGRCEPSADGAVFTVRAVVTSMSPRDRELFRAWLVEEQTGGTTRRYDSNLGSDSNYRFGAGTSAVSRVAEEERRAALDRLDARRRNPHLPGPPPLPDAFGLESELPSDLAGRRQGRKAFGDALRGALSGRSEPPASEGGLGHRSSAGAPSRGSSRSPGPAASPSSSSELSSIRARRQALRERLQERSQVSGATGLARAGAAGRAGVDAPGSGRSESAGRGSARREGAQSLSRLPARAERQVSVPAQGLPLEVPPMRLVPGTPPCLEVDLGSRLVFAREYRKHLVGDGLFVPGMDLGPQFTSLRVRLALPSGRHLVCPAEVVAALPAGVGLALRLSAAERLFLAEEAGV